MSDSSRPPTPLGSPPTQSSRVSPKAWFSLEIQQMMHGFGDCRRPLAESASLVEEIVHQQMTELLHQAGEVAQQRNARFLGIEDFIFLLRKDKVKLRRLLRYMDMKDSKLIGARGFMMEEDDGNEHGEAKQQALVKKRRKICYDFISTIDQTGELLELFDDTVTDEIKQERALRSELQTRKLDHQQYLEFCQARQTSFCQRYKSQKFRDWLLHSAKLDIKPNPMAMEVLSYLAYETVAQIVDLALLVKRDQQVKSDDPFSRAMPGVCVNHTAMPQPASSSSSSQKSPSSASKPSSSPAPSPPSTPTSQAAPSTPQQSSSSSKHKASKKRKKSGPVLLMEMPTDQAIQPADIREAMRRYGSCSGPFMVFAPASFVSKQRLLCS